MRSVLVRTVLVLVFGLAVGPVGGCTRQARFEFTRVCMGVQTTVTVHCAGRDDAVSAAVSAFAAVEDVEQALSDYRPESDAMRFSDLASAEPGRWLPIGGHLCSAMAHSHRISEASDGAFSIAVGRAVGLWRAARRSGRLPEETDRLEAVRLSDWRAIEIDSAGRRARVREPGIRLDFGGIGKGYAAQAAVEELRRRGTVRCMVGLGGDIAVGEPPPGQPGWRIDVCNGLPDLLLRNAAVSTSGDTEQYVEIEGVKYGHIVDVRTGLGFPAPRGVQVTVVASDGAVADALGTAIYASDSGDADRLLRRFDAAAIITRTAPGGEPVSEVLDPCRRLRWAR